MAEKKVFGRDSNKKLESPPNIFFSAISSLCWVEAGFEPSISGSGVHCSTTDKPQLDLLSCFIWVSSEYYQLRQFFDRDWPVVYQWTPDAGFKGSNPAAARRKDKLAEKKVFGRESNWKMESPPNTFFSAISSLCRVDVGFEPSISGSGIHCSTTVLQTQLDLQSCFITVSSGYYQQLINFTSRSQLFPPSISYLWWKHFRKKLNLSVKQSKHPGANVIKLFTASSYDIPQ
jgi:hypothetical protein